MSISSSDLLNASIRSLRYPLIKSRAAPIREGFKTAFLSHSHKDDILAVGLQVLLLEQGCKVYIDWQDATMPETPDRETAAKIQEKIRETDWFLFLATDNSTRSRWCPWEIGYADAEKRIDDIFIIPTHDGREYYGNEYLQLYRQITESENSGLAAFPAGAKVGGIIVKSLT